MIGEASTTSCKLVTGGQFCDTRGGKDAHKVDVVTRRVESRPSEEDDDEDPTEVRCAPDTRGEQRGRGRSTSGRMIRSRIVHGEGAIKPALPKEKGGEDREGEDEERRDEGGCPAFRFGLGVATQRIRSKLPASAEREVGRTRERR